MRKVDAIGNYRVTVSFELIEDNLEEDIYCNEAGDWLLGVDGDWVTCTGERAFIQDLEESLYLKLFEDWIDPEQGHEFNLFRNAPYTNEKAIELKHKLIEFYEKEDRIDQNTLEVDIERIIE